MRRPGAARCSQSPTGRPAPQPRRATAQPPSWRSSGPPLRPVHCSGPWRPRPTEALAGGNAPGRRPPRPSAPLQVPSFFLSAPPRCQGQPLTMRAKKCRRPPSISSFSLQSFPSAFLFSPQYFIFSISFLPLCISFVCILFFFSSQYFILPLFLFFPRYFFISSIYHFFSPHFLLFFKFLLFNLSQHLELV